MKVITDVFRFQCQWQGSVITLGTFDGFHKGHQALLKTLFRIGQKKALPTVLVTYQPNPAMIVNPRKFSTEIYSKQEKINILQHYNPNYSIFIDFTRELARKSASWYLKEVLVGKLKAKVIIIGYDHTFGRNRQGNYKFLRKWSRSYGYEVIQIKKVLLLGITASSSAIRKFILTGDVHKASRMLGRPYFVIGTVIQGNLLGRTIGFPTANLLLDKNKLLPKMGVYIGLVLLGNKKYKAMINIGQNPTMTSGQGLHVEVHILDFSENIYGSLLKVFFLKYIRPEKKFAGPEQLKEQLTQDKQIAAKIDLNKIREIY